MPSIPALIYGFYYTESNDYYTESTITIPSTGLNTHVSTTKRIGLVVRVSMLGVGWPLEAVPLGTKRDKEGES
jgi:hypothetical protein